MSAYLGSMTMAVANHLWQSTIVIGVAWLLTLMLRTNTARTRQRIWMAASLKFMLPFSLLVAAGSHMVHPKPIVQSSPAFYTAMDQWAQPAPAFASALQLGPMGLSASGKGHSTVWDAAPVMLTAVWLCGFAVIVSLWGVRWRRLKRMQRAAIQMPEGRETAALGRVQQRNGTRSAIRMLCIEGQTGRRMEPGVMGVRRLVLLWPDGISERLSDAQLETIFAHEMQHVKHRDNLMAMLHMAVEAVFWFHPLVWWMETRLVEERERACDEEVLRMGSKPAVYAQSILKTCEFCVESPMACVAGVTGGELKKRIMQIMARRLGRELSLTKKVLLASAAVLVVAGPMMFGLVYAPQVRAQVQGTEVVAPKLEIVSVKKVEGRPNLADYQLTPTGLSAHGFPVGTLIHNAYVIEFPGRDLIVGVPSWANQERYDIVGKVGDADEAKLHNLNELEKGAVTRAMTQQVLRERFQMKSHVEGREQPFYALVAAKDGMKLKKATPGDTYADGYKDPRSGKALGAGMWFQSGKEKGVTVVEGQGVTLDMLALLLMQSGMGQAVVNKTGSTDRYDFTLSFVPEPPAGAPAADDSQGPTGPSLLMAVEQLGLRLEQTKGPVKTLVIDSIERPTEN